jgi:hypothetical protein
MENNNYDSSNETWRHIHEVAKRIHVFAWELMRRSIDHDQSKLEPVEKELFDKYTTELRSTTYGSEEYDSFLAKLKPALDHHYARNRHHPEFFPNGVREMNLVDLIEMLCDWKAATLRMESGDLHKSLEINKKRFDISDELMEILTNTAHDFGLFNKG